MSAVEWTVASNPPPPVLRATVKNELWNLTSETMKEESNLVVLENSLLILMCVASYPVFWYKNHSQIIKSQRRTYNPVLEFRSLYGYNHKNYTASDNFSIPAIDQYQSIITFRNLSINHSELFTCAAQEVLANLQTTVSLSVQNVSATHGTPEILQAGFSSVRPAATWSSRYFTRRMEINNIIYKIPPGAKFNQSVLDPRGKSINLPSENETIMDGRHYVITKSRMITGEIWQTKIILNQGVFYDNGFYHFKIQGHFGNGTSFELDHSFNFDCNVGSENLKDVTRVDPFNCNAVLTVKNYYEVRMYVLDAKHLMDANVRVTELDLQADGCKETSILPFMANEMCGIIGVSFFNESSLEIGIRVFLRVMGPCVLSAHVHSSSKIPSSQLYITAVDPQVFGSEVDGKFTSNPPQIVEKNLPMFINEPLTIRCLVPACSLSKISVQKNYYFSWPPFENNILTIAWKFNGHLVTAFKYDPNPSAYHQGFRACTLAYDWTFESLTVNDSGEYACLLWMPSSATGTRSIQLPATPFNLEVLEPRAPAFDDGAQHETVKVSLKRGGKTTLTCNVNGTPNPKIFWHLPPRHDNQTANQTIARVIDPQENSTLEIYDVGAYTCNARNKFGNDSRTFEVEYENDAIDLRLAISIPVAIFALLLFGLIFWWLRRKSIDASFKELEKLLKNPHHEIPIDDTAPLNDQVKYLPYNRKYEISRDSFTLTSKLLGSGEFGSVFKGELKLGNGGTTTRPLAIKIPKDLSRLELHHMLIDELKVMSHIRPHVNVLELVGACTSEIGHKQLFILTEFCEHGSLAEYLAKNSMKFEGFAVNELGQFVGTPGSVEALLKYSYQAANGMEHLAAEKIIHRDLALRNLLLTGNHIVKISDFGMSRHDTSVYRKKLSPDVPVPLFWMALESLLIGQYTQKSDVWSFGIVLWEMFSCAKRPYPDHEPNANFRLWLSESEDNRLGLPSISCDEIYHLMRKCWGANPEERPTFSQCKRIISQTLEQKAPAMYQSILSSLSDAWRNIASQSESIKETDEEEILSEKNGKLLNEDAQSPKKLENGTKRSTQSNAVYVAGVMELENATPPKLEGVQNHSYVAGSECL